jgi:amidase
VTALKAAPEQAAQAADSRIWRAMGDPLLPATGVGQLRNMSVAVKDLFALEGYAVVVSGALSESHCSLPAPTASAAAALLAAGAVVAGIARTDEFAYSLAGTNTHYGTPPNPKAPGRISGGSSSGSASAVALGQATIGLGTDTGGSIRVPAAYQGLFGFRTTHGDVSRDGLLPLAPSFDTVGWLTRDAETLAAVGNVLLPATPPNFNQADSQNLASPLVQVSQELLALADNDVENAVGGYLADWAVTPGLPDLTVSGLRTEELSAWADAFRTVQAHEAWQQHGTWISTHWDSLGADVAGRFRTASQVDGHQAQRARDVLGAARQYIRSVIGNGLLVLPSASSVAPLLREAAIAGEGIENIRRSTMQLTCIAGIAGLPAVTIPLTTADGLPCGLSIIGPAHRDANLLALAVLLSETFHQRKNKNA